MSHVENELANKSVRKTRVPKDYRKMLDASELDGEVAAFEAWCNTKEAWDAFYSSCETGSDE